MQTGYPGEPRALLVAGGEQEGNQPHRTQPLRCRKRKFSAQRAATRLQPPGAENGHLLHTDRSSGFRRFALISPPGRLLLPGERGALAPDFIDGSVWSAPSDPEHK